jgi:hypothetical protein
MLLPIFTEKEKNSVSAPHPPLGGILTHNGNYSACNGGGMKSIISGLPRTHNLLSNPTIAENTLVNLSFNPF